MKVAFTIRERLVRSSHLPYPQFPAFTETEGVA